MPTIKVILNPASGRGAGQRTAEVICHTLTEAKATEVLNGIIEASLGVPIGDVAAACRVLAAGKTRVVDVGHVAQRGPQQPAALPGRRSALGAQP